MPSNIGGGLISFIEQNTNPPLTVYQGEIPRQDVNGVDINPPCFKLIMPPEGLPVNFTTEDAYWEQGTMKILLWTTTLAQCEMYVLTLFNLLVNEANWDNINVGPNNNVFELLIPRTAQYQLEDMRVRVTEGLLFQGELDLEVGVGGTVKTR